jgi:hypothetical protein
MERNEATSIVKVEEIFSKYLIRFYQKGTTLCPDGTQTHDPSTPTSSIAVGDHAAGAKTYLIIEHIVITKVLQNMNKI